MPIINPPSFAEKVLTEREFEIYKLFGEGKKPKEIAKILFLSPKTISTHRNNLVKKMGFKSTYDLMHHSILFHLHEKEKV